MTPTTLVCLPLQEQGAWNAEKQSVEAQKIHAQAHNNIVQANSKYKHKTDKGFKDARSFKVGDYCMQFPTCTSGKNVFAAYHLLRFLYIRSNK